MLTSFFSPASVAVIGASRTPGKVGYDVVRNLVEGGFQGTVVPVNPKAEEVLGLPCAPSVDQVDGPVELAVLCIPSAFVLDAIEQCARKDIHSVIIITAGFKESGAEGAELERQLTEACRRDGIRCIGPNCLGVMSPITGLNASFGATMPGPGRIAFFSQSGALGTAILDACVGEDIGMSRFISYGNKADVDETDLIEALGEDDETDVILGYVESVNDGRKFIDVASRVTRKKPVVILKSGRTSAGARAASSHTGSLAGADTAYEAAFRQCGVFRANTVEEFFDFARVLSGRTLPADNRIAIVTNAGGPGIIATDAVESSLLRMADLAETTVSALTEALPPQANRHNPVDVLGDARADRYRTAFRIVGADPNVSAVLTILTPQTSTEVEETAAAVIEASEATDKPIVATFMGSQSVRPAWRLLDKAGVANFPRPDQAVKAMETLYRYGQWRGGAPSDAPRYAFDDGLIRKTIAGAAERGHTTLAERDARDIAEACGIALPKSVFAADEEAAVEAAGQVGYPVVLKISSDDILHKSDAGGVKVRLADAEAVRTAFRAIMDSARRYKPDARLDGVLVQQMAPSGREVIIGVNRDAQFGPVIMFGLGGIYVEVLKDVTFRVAPLTLRDAREMVSEIRAARILQAFRGDPPADVEALAECLTRVSQLAVEYPELTECDLNPLRVYPEGQGVMAVDVRFGLA
ncbi:MAG: CoA-binding protein [Candidatus Brocadiaceae bacterium]|nr:CoA-binding protein [Candidatus Brocadiaceae bacterium]